MAETAAKNLSFEQALTELDQVVRDLEDGQIGLEHSLERYEKGVGLLKHCYGLLQGAEKRIRILTGVDENGQPITQEFGEPAEPAPTGRIGNPSHEKRRKKDENEDDSSELF